MMRRRKTSDDEGVALVMALVFITIVATFAVVALSKSQTTTVAGEALRSRGQVQYALDGGIDYGLNKLVQEMRIAGPSGASLCATPGAASSLGSLTLNGSSVDLTCTNFGGSSRDGSSIIDNFALVVRGNGADALRTYGPGGAVPPPAATCSDTPSGYFRIGGAVYLAGVQQNTPVDPGLLVCDGDVVEQQSSTCAASATALTHVVIGTAGHVRDCTDQTPEEATPTLVLPSRPASDPDVSACHTDFNAAGLPTYSGCTGSATGAGRVCRVFYPGHYTAYPDLAGGSDGNYFASGTYYFDNATHNMGRWTVSGKVVAGARTSTNDVGDNVGATNCSGINDASVASIVAPLQPGSAVTRLSAGIDVVNGGAQWILDGTSALEVTDLLTINSSRHPAADPPATLVFGGYTPWSPPPGTSTPVASSTSCTMYYALCNSNSSSNLSINGRLIAPTANVNLFSSQPTDNAVTGGAVVGTIRLGASLPGSAATLVTAPSGTSALPPPYRTVLLTATTSGTTDQEHVVATISNFGTFAARVKSWRSD
jgi:hypothetical protein